MKPDTIAFILSCVPRQHFAQLARALGGAAAGDQAVIGDFTAEIGDDGRVRVYNSYRVLVGLSLEPCRQANCVQ